jgi:hypothetical protein
MMEALGAAGLTALVWKVVDFIKFVANKDWNAAVTQGLTWLSSVIISFLAREAAALGDFEVFGQPLAELDWAAVLLFALGLGSSASGVYEFKKAIDNTDGARTPSLLPNASNLHPNAATEPRAAHQPER